MKKYIKPEMDVMNLECETVLLQASQNDIPMVSDGPTIGTGGFKARSQSGVWGTDETEEE